MPIFGLKFHPRCVYCKSQPLKHFWYYFDALHTVVVLQKLEYEIRHPFLCASQLTHQL